MLTRKITDVNILEVIGTSNVSNIRRLFKISLGLTAGINEYLLLAIADHRVLVSGMISFGKSSVSRIETTTFGVDSKDGIITLQATTNTSVNFRIIQYDGREYVAALKPYVTMGENVHVILLHGSSNTIRVVPSSEVTVVQNLN